MTLSPTPPPQARRYTLITLRTPRDTMAEDIRRGLTATPKMLPCKYFYDERGMALFDRICQLPEYYLTRVETGILREHAADVIGRCPAPLDLVELGNGSSAKTRYLIEPSLARQRELVYCAVDISPSALEEGARPLLREYETLKVVGLAGEFADGLRYLKTHLGGLRLVAFLGSTVGNFTEEELTWFFTLLREALRPEDRFLLGVDLAKDPALLLAAYDDPEGVTAQFNLNLLARINRELGADFDVDAFRHRAVFDARRSRVEMHLVSRRDQTVHVGALGLAVPLREGESIHTENCYKHSREAVQALLARHGFETIGLFTDPDQWFGLFLVQ
jgi:dimethylhistidine N-methyltransferase